MVIELCQNNSCSYTPQSIIALTLTILGYIKYLIAALIITYYYAYYRNTHRIVGNQEEIDSQSQETEHVLSDRIKQVQLSEPCSICMELDPQETVVELECGHYFHMKCVKDWVKIKGSCPMCRNYVRN